MVGQARVKATQSEVVVREATLDDFAAIRGVAAAANEEFRLAMGERVHQGYLANVLDLVARSVRSVILVADAGANVVGTVTFYPDANDEGMPVRFPPGTAGLRATAVSPAWRRRGVGHELVSAVLARAERHGANAVALHTARCMTAATKLYEQHGFRRVADLDYLANDFLAGGDGDRVDALAYVRLLAASRAFSDDTESMRQLLRLSDGRPAPARHLP
jgi:ribosomal protein S18 acetylase RimI-like enzyme